MNNKKFEDLKQYEQEFVIDDVNRILDECECNAHLEKTNWKGIKEFACYIKTDEDVLNHNIAYFEIKCPIEFLDVEKIIKNDDDYEDLPFNLHLHIDALLNDIDDCIERGILIDDYIDVKKLDDFMCCHTCDNCMSDEEEYLTCILDNKSKNFDDYCDKWILDENII